MNIKMAPKKLLQIKNIEEINSDKERAINQRTNP